MGEQSCASRRAVESRSARREGGWGSRGRVPRDVAYGLVLPRITPITIHHDVPRRIATRPAVSPLVCFHRCASPRAAAPPDNAASRHRRSTASPPRPRRPRAPAHQHTSTPAHQHTSTPAHQHTSTPAHQHTSTPARQHTSTPAHQPCAAVALRHYLPAARATPPMVRARPLRAFIDSRRACDPRAARGRAGTWPRHRAGAPASSERTPKP